MRQIEAPFKTLEVTIDPEEANKPKEKTENQKQSPPAIAKTH